MSWKAGFAYLGSSVWRFARRRPVVSFAIGIWLLLLIGNGVKGVFDLGPRTQASAPITELAPQPAQKHTPVPVVSNSAWDGAVWQVEQYLERNLKDPDSFEAIEWSNVLDTGNGYTVRCKYRARNSFGGMVIENQLFRLSPGGDVLSAIDLRAAP